MELSEVLERLGREREAGVVLEEHIRALKIHIKVSPSPVVLVDVEGLERQGGVADDHVQDEAQRGAACKGFWGG